MVLIRTKLLFLATPFGQVPVLEVDGVPISQSTSIARFLAKEFNLAGKDHLEQAQADMVVDACNDLMESEYFSKLALNLPLVEELVSEQRYSSPTPIFLALALMMIKSG